MKNIDASTVQLLAKERPRDLHDLVMGTSPYCGETSNFELPDDEEGELLTLAIHHLLYIDRFGSQESGKWVGERYYQSHAEDFEMWVTKGCPGLMESDLRMYLKDNPILGQKKGTGLGE